MKYSAEDFKNAKFAEHPESGKVAAKVYPHGFPEDDEPREWESRNDYLTNSDMARDGWVPAPTKPTLTEAEVDEIVPTELPEEYVTGFIHGFEKAGGEVVPDPEPTNKERLEALQRSWVAEHPVLGGKSLIEYLNDHGVTAPNVKDN